jgi:hypothetical protein
MLLLLQNIFLELLIGKTRETKVLNDIRKIMITSIIFTERWKIRAGFL